MILHLDKNLKKEKVEKIAQNLEAVFMEKEDKFVLVTTSKIKKIPAEYENLIIESFCFDNDMQLSAKSYKKQKRQIDLKNISFGGTTKNVLMMAGPCSVESEEQIQKTAELLLELNLTTLRAGSYKPRTSPYSFQGMGLQGLKLLAKIRDKYGFNIITEVRDSTHMEEVIEYADIVQIGAKSMYDHGILRRCGKAKKPVLIKRGFGTTLQEFVQASEFILSGGNEDVILCERGIRTFESKTRFTLDLTGVAFLKQYTSLPIVLDPSHAMGYSYGVADLSRACVAMGIDGLLIETHHNPKIAKSDAAQQLEHEQFKQMFETLKPIANAIGMKMV